MRMSISDATSPGALLPAIEAVGSNFTVFRDTYVELILAVFRQGGYTEVIRQVLKSIV